MSYQESRNIVALITTIVVSALYFVFMVGFVLAMGSLVTDLPPYTLFMLLLSFGFLAELVGDRSQRYFYRRGL